MTTAAATIARAADTSRNRAEQQYRELVNATAADDLDTDPEEATAILDAAGRTGDAFMADVQARVDRLRWAETLATKPDLEAERRMLIATTGISEEKATPVLTADELRAAQRLVRRVPVGESVVEAILRLVRSGRPDVTDIPEARESIAWGPGPRASQALMLAARARALLDNRLSPSIDDVVALAGPVLRHRMALTFAARADGITIGQIIDRLTAPLR